ncbi:MAG: energy transducer TonB [Rubrivivax sp.]|nr:energy transducer TonB [Rubrivivax sp.]HRY90142.1 energy transducer TonB [Rubrivivax sp.]
MDYAQQQRDPRKHLLNLSVVVLLHLLLGWALVAGLGRKVIEVVRAPIETKIIEEVKPPPPPPPENLPPPPKTAPPPPSFVPPPEIQVANPPPAPTITTTTVVPPPAPPVRIEPAAPGPAAPPAPPAPPAAPVRTAPKLDFNACAKPEYNAATRRAEAQGTVVVKYTMDVSGVITEAEVERSAGMSREHKMLDRMTLEAVKGCKGTPGTVDGKPEKLSGRIEYVWKIVD